MDTRAWKVPEGEHPMTQPHPQQDHEKVWKLTASGDAGMTIEWDTDLAYLRNQKRRYENMGMDCRIEESLCQPDTPTPAAPAERLCDDGCNIFELEERVMELEQQVKAEREKMLERLEDFRKYSNGEYNEAYLSDNEREMRIHNDYGCKIWGIMESLRGGATEEGGERR